MGIEIIGREKEGYILKEKEQKPKKSRKFRMRSAPIRPKKQKQVLTISLYQGQKLSVILKEMVEENNCRIRDWGENWKGFDYITEEWLRQNMDDIEIIGDSCWGRTESVSLHLKEPDEMFASRMKKYDDEVAEYKKWRERHVEEIAAHEAELNRKAEERKRKVEAREAKRKEEHRQLLEKQLENIQKTLNKLNIKQLKVQGEINEKV